MIITGTSAALCLVHSFYSTLRFQMPLWLLEQPYEHQLLRLVAPDKHRKII